jgi:hypothetical protein
LVKTFLRVTAKNAHPNSVGWAYPRRRYGRSEHTPVVRHGTENIRESEMRRVCLPDWTVRETSIGIGSGRFGAAGQGEDIADVAITVAKDIE